MTMKLVRNLSIAVVVLILLLFLAVQSLIIHVPVGSVGVRVQQYGFLGEKGLVTEDFGPGWHRDFGPIDNWQIFDSTVQTLEMTRDPGRGSRRGRDDVQVQSADGYSVSVDVTVKYRIEPGKAHQLYQDTGGGTAYERIVRNESEQACIAVFGSMETEDFYDPTKRREAASQAHDQLQVSLKDNFVNVVDLLIRDVQFDKDYERKIQSKKLADQEVEVQRSQEKATQMRGKTQVIEAETERLVKIIQEERQAEIKRMQAQTDREIAKIVAEYNKYAQQKRADADAYAAKKIAEGTLQVKQAEAEGERLRNRAMMGVGGSTLVALEAARNLSLGHVVVSTVETDLLDVEAMIRKLGMPAQR
jgi:regulator of protease activity HflC (stomatin/prohibitin superfamily)